MMQPPSDQNERATSKPVHIPTVLAVGCSDALLGRCWDVLAGMGVMVRDCEPAHAATLAASRQPLAIVVARHAYARDPEEFAALARDVRAALLCIDESAGGLELAAALAGAIHKGARRRDGRTSSGRYSILPGGATGSEPPPSSVVRPTSLVLDELEEELLAALR